ncbi:MAG: GntR family transcriptional regulator [Lachnospiraceae bacterium]|nr:GntR family transcriptional regulator [Lachnospiraceae bacterium]
MFTIDLMSRVPVYEQIIEQMENFVIKGVLSAGTQVPSVRSLSVQLSINPNTIQKAYTELDRRGIIYSVPGRGCFISDTAMDILCNNKRKQLEDLKNLLKELSLVGVTKDEVISIVTETFEN